MKIFKDIPLSIHNPKNLPSQANYFVLFFFINLRLCFRLRHNMWRSKKLWFFLGLLKGLIGLVCFSTIGMCGLTLLANLPCRLDKYYEPDLSDYIVEYDDSGWPVHPQTHRRTVRLMSRCYGLFAKIHLKYIICRKAEFCLNTIFFLAYPLVALSALCDYCCGSPVCDTDSNSLESKRIVRVARFSNMVKLKLLSFENTR